MGKADEAYDSARDKARARIVSHRRRPPPHLFAPLNEGLLPTSDCWWWE